MYDAHVVPAAGVKPELECFDAGHTASLWPLLEMGILRQPIQFSFIMGVLGGIGANAYVVDAIIGLSVTYKAFDNIGGFDRVFGVRPNPKAAVLVFGLFHGFGLATKVQEFTLSDVGLVTNMLSFNVGVEIGQILALTMVLIGLTYWRSRASFLRYAFATNVMLMTGGVPAGGESDALIHLLFVRMWVA